MKRLLLTLAIIAILCGSAQATPYYPVYGGSLVPYTGDYLAEFGEWVQPTFFGTVAPVTKQGGYIPYRGDDPEYWNNSFSISWMPWLSAFAQTEEGQVPVFTDYIMGYDWVYSFESHDVAQRPGTVPLPPSALLLATGMICLGLMRRRVRG